jgi:small subunit ribosomal protein S6
MSTTLGKLREYETVFVVNPDLGDDIVNNDVIDRLKGIVTKMSGEMLREDRWGKRKLSFEMKAHGRGNYFLFHYVGEVGIVAELERSLRNNEHVIRYVSTLNGPVTDIAAKKAEVEKMVHDRAAEKAKLEAERKEREAKMAERGESGDREFEDGDDFRDRGDRGDRGRDRDRDFEERE